MKFILKNINGKVESIIDADQDNSVSEIEEIKELFFCTRKYV